MKTKVVYITKDGKSFNEEKNAIAHESKLDSKAKEETLRKSELDTINKLAKELNAKKKELDKLILDYEKKHSREYIYKTGNGEYGSRDVLELNPFDILWRY